MKNIEQLEQLKNIDKLKNEKDQKIFNIIKDNFYSTFANCNFLNLQEFKDKILELFDCENLFYSGVFDYLKENDISLRKSLKLAENFGYSVSNLDSEILASLLCKENFKKELSDYNNELEIIRNFLDS